jgi:HSP20 family protein
LTVPFDVHETEDAYVLTADVPGVKQSALDITVEEKAITVSGKREDAADAKAELRSRERRQGSFSRTFRLRDSVDAEAISAELSNGVLTLTVPKTAEAKPRTIPITAK